MYEQMDPVCHMVFFPSSNRIPQKFYANLFTKNKVYADPGLIPQSELRFRSLANPAGGPIMKIMYNDKKVEREVQIIIAALSKFIRPKNQRHLVKLLKLGKGTRPIFRTCFFPRPQAYPPSGLFA